MLVDELLATLLAGNGVSDGLGGGLRAERDLGVADVKALPIDGAHGDAKVLRVNAGKLGDVGGHLARVDLLGLVVDFLNLVPEEVKED